VVTAIVLVRAEIQRIPEVAEMIAQIPEVSEVYSVTGEFDLVAMVRDRSHEELADVIPGRLRPDQRPLGFYGARRWLASIQRSSSALAAPESTACAARA
jgi:DNA-binding Lrp family transcriptional regulator